MLGDDTLGDKIAGWIREYAESNGISTLVVGVSGGVDSAVTSTLCAMTGIKTIALNLPINQDLDQFDLSNAHISWLEDNWENAEGRLIDLSATFRVLADDSLSEFSVTDMALANTKARLRMTTLYAISASNNGIVVGTGNKVEDFGVGFYTKYGDGGVDISPIADLMKSEVYQLGHELGVLKDILVSSPTDGLWEDGRTDEDQIGATYEELEWAMEQSSSTGDMDWTPRQIEVMRIFNKFNTQNSHKMNPIPVYINS